jgi:hypothetical protein
LICQRPSWHILFQIIDIRSAADIAHPREALLCVDNSTMSPYLQRPLELGADIVVHSATKFLCGHSDVMADAVVVSDEELGQERSMFTLGTARDSDAPKDTQSPPRREGWCCFCARFAEAHRCRPTCALWIHNSFFTVHHVGKALRLRKNKLNKY